MLVDKDRRFLLQLSLKLGVPIHELEEYPASTINEYKALNLVSPFINDSEIVREGLLLQLIRNQNVTKKQHMKTAEQLLPYLQEYPDYLEHPTIKKLNSLLKSCTSDEQVSSIMEKVLEEIEIESKKVEPDQYLISRLYGIYINKTKATK